MKQTAIDWLVEQILKEKKILDLDIEQAKQMEKEQITFAYGDGQQNGREFQEAFYNGEGCNVITSEQYYSEVYK